MDVIKSDIEGVLIIEPRLFWDARGYFFESFSEREFQEKVESLVGYKVEFCQDNESMSSYGVMRGLHFQRPPFTQSKLVRCVKGRVLDVAVDIRKGSPTYGKHVAVELTRVSRYWMNHSGSIGAFLRNMLIFRKRIRSMRCWRTLILLLNTNLSLTSRWYIILSRYWCWLVSVSRIAKLPSSVIG